MYIAKFRNLEYLESELAGHRLREEEQRQEQAARVKKMRERLLKEEVELLRNGGDLKGKEGRISGEENDNDNDDVRKKQQTSRERERGMQSRDRRRVENPSGDDDSIRGSRPLQQRKVVQKLTEDEDEEESEDDIFGSSEDDEDGVSDDNKSDDNHSDDDF